MTTPGPRTTSDTARLLVDAPSFAVGWQQPIYVPNPAVGQNWKHTVDGRYSERLLAATFVFTADAVVGDRFPAMNLVDTNGVIITSVPAGDSVVASSGLSVFLTLHGPAYSFGASGGTFGFIPDILVPPGWAWQSSVAGIDPGDQLSAIVLLVQQFPNDATSISAIG